MKPGAKIYKERGRLIRARNGKWILTYTLASDPGRPGTGYQQIRGERDDLIEYAQNTLGMKTVFLPGIVGELPIEMCKTVLNAQETKN